MAGTTSTATVATPGQPQTTVEPTGGPFVRHSEPGKGRIYDLTAQAFGALINQPLTALPGYASKFRLYFKATGGVNGNSSLVTAAGDAPESCVALITLWDALGTPIVSGPGYEILRLIPMFSGGFGLGGEADTHNLPSYSAIAGGTTVAGTGNFTFATAIPLEFAKAYGVLGMADGDVLPKLQIQLAGTASVYTTAPPTAPTLEVRLNADYYWLPQGQGIAPPGLGTTRQWFLQQGNPQPAANTTATVTIPRQGGWLDTIIFICRDANGVRQDAWPTIFRFALDGIGEISTNIDEIYDDMAITFGVGSTSAVSATAGVPRPTGVIAISRKTSLGQKLLGLLDTYEVALSTSPGTSMTVEGAPWGSGGTGPYTINALLGQVIPSGTLIQGLEEV